LAVPLVVVVVRQLLGATTKAVLERNPLGGGLMTPHRIQRRRTKGWTMPPDTIYVGRPSRWGNQFEVGVSVTPETAVERYALLLETYFEFLGSTLKAAFAPWPVEDGQLREWLKPLRGKNLACWCPLDQPCHADLLLKLANA
jgi:hypothetical protein